MNDTDICRWQAMEMITKLDGDTLKRGFIYLRSLCLNSQSCTFDTSDTSTILKYLAMIENSDKPDRDEKLAKIEVFVKRMYLA